MGALNKMVEQYNEAKEEYGADTYQWVINGIHNKIASVLDSREYKNPDPLIPHSALLT